LAANLDAAPLSDGEVDEPAMLDPAPALQIDDIAGPAASGRTFFTTDA
jgi:hypothetical protein